MLQDLIPIGANIGALTSGRDRTYPFICRDTILKKDWPLILWTKAVINRNNYARHGKRDLSAEMILGLEISCNPSASMKENTNGEFALH